MSEKETLIIYFNPRCGKCRTAKASLEGSGFSCNIVEYLQAPPTKKELVSLLKKLGKKPLEIIRTKEEVFKEHFAGKKLSDEQWIDAIIHHPILMERPIVVKGNKAWVARDEETLSFIVA